MATSYTYDIYKGKDVSFEDFALRCARAFGALIHMRDMPEDAPLPDVIEPCEHTIKRYGDAMARLNEMHTMTNDAKKRACDAAYEKALADYAADVAENEARQARYKAMITAVDTWAPPTADHIELKRFMLQQLTDSLRFDCHEPTKPGKRSVIEWYERQLFEAKRAATSAEEDYLNEIKRAKDRTEWVKALRASLGR